MKMFLTKITKIASLGILLASALSASAVTVSFTVAGNTTSNVPNVFGPAKVTQIILSSPVSSSVSVGIYDSPATNTPYLIYTNLGYTNIITYATNVLNTYTNYYGVVNTNFNNTALVDATNIVAANTNVSYPLRISLVAPTNGSMRADNVNYYFQNGIVVTNTSATTATLTMTLVQ